MQQRETFSIGRCIFASVYSYNEISATAGVGPQCRCVGGYAVGVVVAMLMCWEADDKESRLLWTSAIDNSNHGGWKVVVGKYILECGHGYALRQPIFHGKNLNFCTIIRGAIVRFADFR